MTTIQFIIFLVLFISPSLYQRFHYKLNPAYFYKLSLRKKSGLQIHHGHWGLLWIFVSSILFIFGFINIYTILLAGFGWGLLLDEIIPNLKMPTESRDLELEVYKKAEVPTMILIGSLAVIFIVLFLFLR
jgi:hypothetical protein